eukprot:Nitzschia sp. Nitz4//scaffold167_size49223//23797//24759//NITZ4_007035-RA/size49223-processed-gene-0.19-mRNA-1//1//CDS//3329538275//4710//frame0
MTIETPPETNHPNNSGKTKLEDSTSASCQKCVKVLRDMIAGIQSTHAATNKSSSDSQTTSNSDVSSTDSSSSHWFHSSSTNNEEPPPLTLLKAMSSAKSEDLKVEWVNDGVRIHIPVETTNPTTLAPWSKLQEITARASQVADSLSGAPSMPLALSVQDTAEGPADTATVTKKTPQKDPLTVELKCRKCASTGPEAGARAFLMGPQPLSVVLCHNRIQSHPGEIQEILTHELVHLYDVQTLRLDLQDCETLAYSEIRAAKAAECRNSWHPQLLSFCVKQKATCATSNLFPQEGRACMQRVFDHAFEDTRPFQKPQQHQQP